MLNTYNTSKKYTLSNYYTAAVYAFMGNLYAQKYTGCI